MSYIQPIDNNIAWVENTDNSTIENPEESIKNSSELLNDFPSEKLNDFPSEQLNNILSGTSEKADSPNNFPSELLNNYQGGMSEKTDSPNNFSNDSQNNFPSELLNNSSNDSPQKNLLNIYSNYSQNEKTISSSELPNVDEVFEKTISSNEPENELSTEVIILDNTPEEEESPILTNNTSSPFSPNKNEYDDKHGFDLSSNHFINSEIYDDNTDTSVILTLTPSPVHKKAKKSFMKDITQNTFMGMLIFNFLVNS